MKVTDSRNIPEHLEDIEKIVQDFARVLKKGFGDTLKEVLGEKPSLEICSKCGSFIPIDDDQYPLNFEPGNIVFSGATQRYGLVLKVKSKKDLPIIGIITVLTRGTNTTDLGPEDWGILKNEKSITIQAYSMYPFLNNLCALLRYKKKE